MSLLRVVVSVLVFLSVGAAASDPVRLHNPTIAGQVVEFVDTIGRDDAALADLLLTTQPFDGMVQTQAPLAMQFATLVARPGTKVCDAFGRAAAHTLTTMRTSHYPYPVLPEPFRTMRPMATVQAYFRARCRAAWPSSSNQTTTTTTDDSTPLSPGVFETLVTMQRVGMAYVTPR